MADGMKTVFYQQIQEFFVLSHAVWVKPHGTGGLMLPRELFPDQALVRMGRRDRWEGQAKAIGVVIAVALVVVVVLAVAIARGTTENGDNAAGSATSTAMTTAPVTTTPASFDWTSLDSADRDRTQLTTALLPETFTSSAGTCNRGSGGNHACGELTESRELAAVMAEHHCSSALTSSYFDPANRIFVSVDLLVFPSSVDAKAMFDDARVSQGYASDWTLWCPTTGAGSQVCEKGNNTDHTLQMGSFNYSHRYFVHARALYFSLTRTGDSDAELKPVAHAALDATFPLDKLPPR
ncbi:hypothetical protein [Nocardia seriolae]|uniref:Non-specific serine/threonine protein kinase n=2 Tax=Nocardia seriolae TaxID=37332 RepID=A0ABC9Z5A6_9NOCA|nr:hypothetical protein [Nocardia seriolae]APB00186.1 hypothetical protein NS506_06150 [Nocardia seriolae]MTJ64861.1 hypothetical protein [Nocardia seriolae]MTJ76183.1 hypothetical protein [Nocardia seriolae]MTK50257.1 hypothetical protein [Nocardia seriolae]QUN15854.1 hypothetical protein KEC46_26565 [Nocardia seriolae]